MTLSGHHHKQLCEGLLAAFPREGDLAQLVFFGLNENLNHITSSGSTMRERVLDLIIWVEARNRLRDLLQAAYKLNSANVTLLAAMQAIYPEDLFDKPSELTHDRVWLESEIIANLLGLSVDALWARFQALEQQRDAKISSRRFIEHNLLVRTLKYYYSQESLDREGLARYTFRLGDTSVETTIVVRPNWINLAIELDGKQEHCRLVRTGPPKVHMPEEPIAQFLSYAHERKLRLYNAPIYRLIDPGIKDGQLATTFALDAFYRYQFTIGLLEDELKQALTAADLDISQVVSKQEELLSLRQQLLPNPSSLVAFTERMCAGGLGVVFAIARPKPEHDYLIAVQRRSGKVADGRGLLALIPKAFHQPMKHWQAEINRSFSVYRELYEELFGGKEVQRGGGQRAVPDWFFHKSAPLRWFREHEGAYQLVCTNFGINMLRGTYDYGILLLIQDESYWRKYRGKIKLNWEVIKSRDTARIVDNPDLVPLPNLIWVSSKDPDALADLMQRPGWAGESLVAFVEGLLQLQILDSKRVILPPDLVRTLPFNSASTG